VPAGPVLSDAEVAELAALAGRWGIDPARDLGRAA
jgi:hypothetical protein